MAGKKNTVRDDNFRLRYEKGTNNLLVRVMLADGKKKFVWAAKEAPDGLRFVPLRNTELRR